jgi:Tol biopolymer transport system component
MDQGRYVVAWLQGTRMRTFRFEGEAFHPASTPAGGPVYFELVAGGHSRIMALDTTTGKAEVVVSPDFDPAKPAVSPDGRTVTFVTRGALTIRRAGGTLTQALPGPVRDVSFFPDSVRVAVSAGPEGHAHIFILDLASGRTDQLTDGLDEEISPAVSPEGGSLAFTRSRYGTEQIWVQNVQSGASRQITGGQCNSFSPAWEPVSAALFSPAIAAAASASLHSIEPRCHEGHAFAPPDDGLHSPNEKYSVEHDYWPVAVNSL